MFPRPFLLPCHSPLQSPAHSNRQLQLPRSIFQGIMQPALLDLLPVHHHTSLGRYRLARNHSKLIPTPLGLPLFRLFSLYLWLHSTSRRAGIFSEIIESGERCGTEYCYSPSPGGTRCMCRVSPLQSPPSCALCQAFV